MRLTGLACVYVGFGGAANNDDFEVRRCGLWCTSAMSQPGEVGSTYSGERSLVVGRDWLRPILQVIMIALSTGIRIEGCEGAPLLRWLRGVDNNVEEKASGWT
jgi:hypothetical protein